MAAKDLKNLKVLRSIRVAGKHCAVGDVIAKTDFQNKGDWQDLVVCSPAKLEETDEPVGKPKAKSEPKLPGSGK